MVLELCNYSYMFCTVMFIRISITNMYVYMYSLNSLSTVANFFVLQNECIKIRKKLLLAMPYSCHQQTVSSPCERHQFLAT